MWTTQLTHLSGKSLSIQTKVLIGLGVVCQLLGGLLLWNGPDQAQSWSNSMEDDFEVVSNVDDVIWIDVAGAVAKPGVYQLSAGSLVVDAINEAGGFKTSVDREFVTRQLNLADKVKTGDKLYLPSEQETEYQGEVASWCETQLSDDSIGNVTGMENEQLISINTASKSQLMSLPGVGEVRATDIIQNRPFESLGELVDEGVISSGLFNDLQNLIKL